MARPTAADLTFSPDISVGTADSHATSATIAVVVGVERTGESGGGGARIGVGELERLHRSGEEEKGQRAFMILKEKIVLCCFTTFEKCDDDDVCAYALLFLFFAWFSVFLHLMSEN